MKHTAAMLTESSLQSLPTGLRLDRSGTIRVGRSRVTFDLVVGQFEEGASAEDIVALVPTEGEKWPDERAELRPAIEETRAQLGIYAWRQGRYKKRVMTDRPGVAISEKWAALTKDKPRFIKVCGDFAKEAIRAHPFEVARLSITKCALAFARIDAPSRLEPRN